MAIRIRTIFAGNLKRIRKDKGLSQEALALKAGIERAYFGLVERQESSPTIDMVAKIAAVLGVDPADLLKAQQKTKSK